MRPAAPVPSPAGSDSEVPELEAHGCPASACSSSAWMMRYQPAAQVAVGCRADRKAVDRLKASGAVLRRRIGVDTAMLSGPGGAGGEFFLSCSGMARDQASPLQNHPTR